MRLHKEHLPNTFRCMAHSLTWGEGRKYSGGMTLRSAAFGNVHDTRPLDEPAPPPLHTLQTLFTSWGVTSGLESGLAGHGTSSISAARAKCSVIASSENTSLGANFRNGHGYAGVRGGQMGLPDKISRAHQRRKRPAAKAAAAPAAANIANPHTRDQGFFTTPTISMCCPTVGT